MTRQIATAIFRERNDAATVQRLFGAPGQWWVALALCAR